jgi:16S rRNA (cytosine967-C5)-methyltransferase
VAGRATSGRLVLDACAAPGGKALAIADGLDPGASLVAAELSPPRLAALARQARLWGATNLHVVAADAARPPFRVGFDTVLLDAPCSGLGTLGRRPDIRWRLSPSDIERHASRQAQLLDALGPLVGPGGRLVYSVCSLEPEEGNDVVSAFLARNGEFEPAPLPPWAARFASGPFVATRPERDGADGFFVASLRRAPSAL